MPFNHQLHDPYAVFRSSTKPAGLYARKKWLCESSTPQWKEDFSAAVADLVRGQSADGLWQGSVIETIHRLFGLHLTVRTPDPNIDKGLDALLDIAPAALAEAQPDCVAAERLLSLPFAPGSRAAILFIRPSTLSPTWTLRQPTGKPSALSTICLRRSMQMVRGAHRSNNGAPFWPFTHCATRAWYRAAGSRVAGSDMEKPVPSAGTPLQRRRTGIVRPE